MIELTYLQFIGTCFICGFTGAIVNELLSKVEDLYDEYKEKKNKREQESS